MTQAVAETGHVPGLPYIGQDGILHIPSGATMQAEAGSTVDFSACTSFLAGVPQASTATGITAGTTRTRAGATALAADINRVDTATAPSSGAVLGDGVVLAASVAGDEVTVINNTAYPIQVYGNASDTINGTAGSTGVAIPPGDVALLKCAVAGDWRFEAGLGSSGALELGLPCDTISAAGTGQSTATQLAAQLNNVTTVAAGTGVNLPASASGLQVTVINSGANPLLVYPFQGATDTINGVAATTGIELHPGTNAVFTCTTAGAWYTLPASPVAAAYNTVASAATLTLTAAQVTGGVSSVDLSITGSTAITTFNTPSAAAIVALLHAPQVGTSYRLRIINTSGTVTSALTAGAGVTVSSFNSGVKTIANGVWREFVVTVTAIGTPAVTFESVATGTWS